MGETEDISKQVDQVYKNLLDKFNPAARNLITAGKAYLKALHGAMSASKIYLDALTKVARHSQQGTWGGSSDVGMCLMQMVDVYKEVQSQQMNILKAFYVDLLVPLETNLDKDTKVLQAEQKKFVSTHKTKLETYTKAASHLKKHKKKNRANKGAMDKEIKQYQAVEEERLKLEGFVESSLQNAVTQERRRYGFILERQCSLAKHYLAYHSRGSSLLTHALDNWQDVAKTREALPERLLAMLPSARPRDEGIYSTPLCLEEDAMSISSQVRKARSMDASCLDLSTADEEPPSRPLTRARSEFNLDHNRFTPDHTVLRRSMAIPEDVGRRAMARALYPYLPSGDNQLSFTEMDLIALIGEKNKGWQYGENLRTQRCGWFPVAYTELLQEEDDSALGFLSLQHTRARSSVGDPSCPGPSSLPANIEYRGAENSGPPLHAPPLHAPLASSSSTSSSSAALHHPPPHRPPRGHQKHRSASAGVVQFRAASPTTSTTHASSTSTSAAALPPPAQLHQQQQLHHQSYLRSTSTSQPPPPQHLVSSSSLDTLRSASSSSSTTTNNTVLFNHHQHPQHHYHQHQPKVPAPTLKKSPSFHGTHKPSTSSTSSSSTAITISNPGPPLSTSTRSYTTPASTSCTSSSTSSSSHVSRLHKRGSGSCSFHSSDDSGFSNESGTGSHRPPANPEVDYSDDDNSSGSELHPCRNSLSSRWLWSASSLALTCDDPCNSLPRERDDLASTTTNTTTTNTTSSYHHQYHPQAYYAPNPSQTLPAPGREVKMAQDKRRRYPSLPSLSSLSVDHFVTVARRKASKPKSPCAQKIAAQRERSRRTLRRSSSLLCLGMDSCAGLDELFSADYEDLRPGDWRHTSKIDILGDIPSPPPYDPPPPPTPPPNPSTCDQSTPSTTPRPPMPLPQGQSSPCSSSTHPKSSSEFSHRHSNSSSGNSTLTGSEGEEGTEEDEEEVYMVVRDHRREMTRTIKRSQTRKQVCRSLTWASPTPRSSSSPPATALTHRTLDGPPGRDRTPRDAQRTQKSSQNQRRQPIRAATVRVPNRSRMEPRVTFKPDSPPLPPFNQPLRPQQPIPQPQKPQHTPQTYNGYLHILNYSDFMNRRLKYPEGASRLDQTSLTTGHLCGPWYDLWGDDPSVADV